MKKFLLATLLFFTCFFFDTVVTSASPISGPTYGSGAGNDDTGVDGVACSPSGCIKGYGIRLTVVDENGNKVSRNVVDYWGGNNPNDNYETVGTSNYYRTGHVNSDDLNQTSIQGLASTVKYLGSGIVIGSVNVGDVSSNSWDKKHEYFQKIIDAKLATNDSKQICQEFDFLKDLGYSLCDENGKTRCEDADYLSIEPIFKIYIYGHYMVVSGTEYAAIVQYFFNWNKNIVYNLSGDGGYGLAISGMYLSKIDNKDWNTYKLKSNGQIYSYMASPLGKHRLITNGGTISYTNIGFQQFDNSKAYTEPHSNSMQIIWLKPDKCEPNCCIPCEPDDESVKDTFNKFIENYNKDKSDDQKIACDPNNCEGETEIAIGIDDKGLLVCEPNIPDIPDIPDVPGEPDVPDCDDPDWKRDHPEEWKKYCSTDDSCPDPTLEPEIELVECDDDNANNTSHFRDPIFNSENGEFREYNTYEKMKDLIDPDTGKIKDEIINEIANPENMQNDNTFQAVARANDSQYSTEINEFCSMHCQELFDVVLPDNKPWVYAGRYFRWTIDGSEDEITKAVGTKICAVDIDLDKVIDEYLDALEDARLAAQNQYQFSYYDSNQEKYVSIKGVGAAAAEYRNCDYSEKFIGNSFEENFDNYICAGMGEEGYICGIKNIREAFSKLSGLDESKAFSTYTCDKCYDGFCNCIKNDPQNFLTDEEVLSKIYKDECSQFQQENCVRVTFYDKSKKTVLIEKDSFGWNGGVIKQNRTRLGELPTNDIITRDASSSNYTLSGACKQVEDNYINYISGYADKIKLIYEELKQCNKIGNYIINMGVELNYETLNNNYKYSTLDSKISSQLAYSTEIDEKKPIEGYACITNESNCNKDVNDDGYVDSYFYMNPNNQKIAKTKNLTCVDKYDGELTWIGNGLIFDNMNGRVENSSSEDFSSEGISDWVDYPLGKDVEYNPTDIKMLYFNEFNYDDRKFYYSKSKDGDLDKFKDNIECDEKSKTCWFKFMNGDTNYWNTIYASIVSTETVYKLDKKINACICKDGYVMDIDDNDECNCKRMVSYIDFTGNSVNPTDPIYTENNNYSKITDGGSLTVEFMSGTGFYPISLKYWTLGTVDENEPTVGHFDSIALESKYYKNLPDGKAMCEEGNDSTVCTYGDPGGKCRYYVSNEIIFEPDDIGNCDPGDDDCGKCDPDDEDCIPNIPDDVGECIVDGKPVDECKQLAGLGVIYRIIDLDNPFNDRNPGANWKDTQNINNRVDSDGQIVEGSKLYSSKIDPIYSITMSAADIKKIRRSSIGIDYTIGTVSFPNGSTKDGRSWFLRELIPNNFDEDSFSSLLDKEGGR